MGGVSFFPCCSLDVSLVSRLSSSEVAIARDSEEVCVIRGMGSFRKSEKSSWKDELGDVDGVGEQDDSVDSVCGVDGRSTRHGSPFEQGAVGDHSRMMFLNAGVKRILAIEAWSSFYQVDPPRTRLASVCGSCKTFVQDI